MDRDAPPAHEKPRGRNRDRGAFSRAVSITPRPGGMGKLDCPCSFPPFSVNDAYRSASTAASRAYRTVVSSSVCHTRFRLV